MDDVFLRMIVDVILVMLALIAAFNVNVMATQIVKDLINSPHAYNVKITLL